MKPQYSRTGDKKYPLIDSTYEVVGVPDMYIGRYVCHHSFTTPAYPAVRWGSGLGWGWPACKNAGLVMSSKAGLQVPTPHW